MTCANHNGTNTLIAIEARLYDLGPTKQRVSGVFLNVESHAIVACSTMGQQRICNWSLHHRYALTCTADIQHLLEKSDEHTNVRLNMATSLYNSHIDDVDGPL